MEQFWHIPFLVSGKSLIIQLIINLLSNISSLCISILAYYICSVKAVISSLQRVETQVGAAVNVSPMMAANNPTFTNMMNEFNKNTQTLMIVSKDDLENVVQNAVNRLLEKRENKPVVYLSAEETARRLKVDRSTLWRWNKDGYLTTTKVGNKVRYKLSDVERIQKGEVYE